MLILGDICCGFSSQETFPKSKLKLEMMKLEVLVEYSRIVAHSEAAVAQRTHKTHY